MNKKCNICNKKFSSNDKRQIYCSKSCASKAYRINSPEKSFNRNKRYRIKHDEELKENKKNYYEKNKKCILKKCKIYVAKNKDKIKKNSKIYRIKNRKIINKKANIRRQKREKVDIHFKIMNRSRHRISQAIKHNYKSDTTSNLIGCSVEYLKKYLESKFTEGMTWENYGKNGWHIDHIKPCCAFDLSKKSEQKECFNYTNLQPLWWFDNLQKGGQYYE